MKELNKNNCQEFRIKDISIGNVRFAILIGHCSMKQLQWELREFEFQFDKLAPVCHIENAPERKEFSTGHKTSSGN